MSVDYIVDRENERSCMYCNTTQTAFGPVFEGSDHVEALTAFVAALPDDPRAFRPDRLEEMAVAFVTAMNEEPVPEPVAEPEPSPINPHHVPTGERGPLVGPYIMPDEPPPPQPADPDDLAGNQREVDELVGPEVPAVPPEPVAEQPERPYDARDCWNCAGSGQEPDPVVGELCGICLGRGWLPGS